MLTTSEYAELAARSPHGTHARYNSHLLADEEPCDRCRAAETAYRRELRERRRDVGQSKRPTFTRTNGYRVNDEEPDEDEAPDEDERPWVDDLEDAEADDDEDEDEDEDEYEPDDVPPHRAPEWSRSPFGPAFGKLGGFRLGMRSTPRSRVNAPSANGAGTPSANRSRTDPRSRLRAITKELDTRKPRGPRAVELLAESTSYLTGGVAALPQYGEARGCTPEEITEAERTVVGKRKR